MILPCKTRNAHCARATIELLQTETSEFIPPQLWPSNSHSPDLNPVCGKYCKRTCTKHTSLICSYRRHQLPQWRHDPAWPTPFSVVVSVRPDQWCVFCIPSLAIDHIRCNQLDSKLAIRRPQLKWDKWSFFLQQLNGSTCAISILSSTR